MAKKKQPKTITLTVILDRDEYDNLRSKLNRSITMASVGFSKLTSAELVLARAMYEHEKEGME